jgi:tetratricopeptide (TPR) repeat protein
MAPAFRVIGISIRWGWRDLILTVLLFAVALLAYLPALNGGRILDDDLHITKPELQSIGGLGRIWFDVGATQQYYPVLHTAFWVEHRLWGDAVAGYHLINVLWHACAAGLVVLLMRRLRLPGAWLAAFLFALHPVCVESVAWIAEQKNTLSTVFALGAALAYLHFDQQRAWTHYGLALGWFTLALLSKTAVVTLPATLLVVVWWQRSQLAWRRDVRPLLPWFALSGAVGLITLVVERRLLAGIDANFALTLAGRGLLAGRVFWFYLGKLLWPAGLTFFYPRWTVDTAAGWQYLYPLATGALAAGLGFWARWRRGPLAAFLCFAGTLAPVLGFFNVEWFAFSYVADHLQYLAIPGLIVPLAAVLAMGAERLPAVARRLAPVAAAVLVVALGLLTWRQCDRYRDPVTFYRTAVELNPASSVAHNHLGVALAVLPGHMSEAIAQFEVALQIAPRFAEIHENLGTALWPDPARRTEAVTHLETARRLRPDRKSAHDKLAFALADLPGRLPEAIAEYQASLQIDPADPLMHDALGLALSQEPRRRAEAEAEFEAALRLKPDFAAAHVHLGTLLAESPTSAATAILEYEAALRIEPDSAEVHYNFANLLLRVPGHTAEGLDHFAAALRIRPDFAEAHNNLGLVLQEIPGRLLEAIAHFEAALRARPDFALAENNLGIALASSSPGRLREAAAHFAAALRIDPRFVQARNNLDRAQRLLEQMPATQP